MTYTCECCNYTTQRKFNYDKHLVSNKHKLVKGKTDSIVENIVDQEVFKCNEELNELKIIMERLDKHENKINEHSLQIQNIISEIF